MIKTDPELLEVLKEMNASLKAISKTLKRFDSEGTAHEDIPQAGAFDIIDYEIKNGFESTNRLLEIILTALDSTQTSTPIPQETARLLKILKETIKNKSST